MNPKALLLASALALPAFGETVYTVPQGYTKVTLATPTAGNTALTSISATLLQDVEFAGTGTLGSFTAGAAGSPGSQTITFTGVNWSTTPTNQWAVTADPTATPPRPKAIPYLAYLTDNNGAEEAFLITSNTSTQLTIPSDLDLATRFPDASNGLSVKIRKANTLESIFASAVSQLNGNDRVYAWNSAGSQWMEFSFVAGPNFWVDTSTNAIVGDMAIFPDEGLFVQRTSATPAELTLTLFGEVPSAPQVTTISGTGFMSSRVPIATTIDNLGIATTAWGSNDRLYIWNGAWQDHQYVAGPNIWVNSTTNTPSGSDAVAANSAVFVVRDSAVTSDEGAISTNLPYTVE